MLLDTLIATAIFALVLACLIGPTSLSITKALPNSSDSAVQNLLENERIRVADALKYAGNVIPPTSIATSVPVPLRSPLPVTLRLSIAGSPDSMQTITLSAFYYRDGVATSIQRSSVIPAQVPLPGTILQSSPIAPPTGAP